MWWNCVIFVASHVLFKFLFIDWSIYSYTYWLVLCHGGGGGGGGGGRVWGGGRGWGGVFIIIIIFITIIIIIIIIVLFLLSSSLLLFCDRHHSIHSHVKVQGRREAIDKK